MHAVAQPKLQESQKPKTGIVLMNMGGPSSTDKVGEYLLRIMTDRDMIQLPIQRFDCDLCLEFHYDVKNTNVKLLSSDCNVTDL